MKLRPKAGSLSLKAIYFSLRDALAWRQLDRDPGNRDVTRGDYNVGDNTPHIDRALQLSVVWACIRLIAETISTLPLQIYERREGGKNVPAYDFTLYSLLHDSPNADMTAVEFWEAVMFGLLAWGNAYVLKSYGTGRRVVALDPLNPALMTMRRTLDGAVTYIYADPRGQKEYTERDIWHVKGFGSDGLIGLSPIGVGCRAIAGASAAERASADTYTNNMRPAAVVSTKEFLKPDQREQVKAKVMGAVFGDARTGQLQLLEGGMEYKQLSINPADAQLIENRTFSVEDLCRLYNVPPSMIGHGTAVSNWGTGREQINLGFLQYVLMPYMVRIEQGIKKSLMTPAERTRYYPKYSVEGLLRADSAARAQFYSTMVQNGIMTRNEARALEEWPAQDGGDELTVQSNLIPLKLLGKITNTAQTAKSALLSWLGLDKEPTHEP
jgi:HK97 family phage portal protein